MRGAFFASVRAPGRKISLRAACARNALLAAAGLLTGVAIQFLDRDSPVLGDVFSQMSVWIFFVHRAIRWQRHAPSRGRQRFCLSPAHGRSVLRHCRSAATSLFHDLCHRMGRLRVPIPAFRLFRLVCAGEGPYRFPSARGDPRRDSAVRARAVRRHPNRGYPFRPADRRPAVLAAKTR